jgi:hypothetical protein
MDDHSEHEVLLDILEATCTPSNARSISSVYTGKIRVKGSLKIAGVITGGTSLDHVQLSRDLRPDGESWANIDEVSRAIEEIKQQEDEKRQNTVHLGFRSSKAGTEDKEPGFAENLGSESTGTAAQSPQRDALPLFTEYLRDLDRSSYSYSSRVSELAKNPRMPFPLKYGGRRRFHRLSIRWPPSNTTPNRSSDWVLGTGL